MDLITDCFLYWIMMSAGLKISIYMCEQVSCIHSNRNDSSHSKFDVNPLIIKKIKKNLLSIATIKPDKNKATSVPQ